MVSNDKLNLLCSMFIGALIIGGIIFFIHTYIKAYLKTFPSYKHYRSPDKCILGPLTLGDILSYIFNTLWFPTMLVISFYFCDFEYNSRGEDFLIKIIFSLAIVGLIITTLIQNYFDNR